MRKLLMAMVCAGVIGLPAFAQTIDQRIAAGLEAEGYQIVTLYRTWLGRIYVIAETDDVRREMVFNPATGEVLRDYAVTKGPRSGVADGSDSEGSSPAVAAIAADGSGAAVATATRESELSGNTLGVSSVGADVPSVILLAPVIVPPSD